MPTTPHTTLFCRLVFLFAMLISLRPMNAQDAPMQPAAAEADSAATAAGEFIDPGEAAEVAVPTGGGAEAASQENPILPPEDTLRVPTDNAVVNLINLLVERGVLTSTDASGLVRQAEEEASIVREQATAVQIAANQVAEAAAQESEYSPDDVRVTYIPEAVRNQIRDELRQDILTQARDENWATPRAFPEWTARIRLFGDIRTRFEGTMFPEGNDNTGSFPDFNAINTGSPFDTSGLVFSPQWNTDTDRSRVRLRVRLGLEADLGSGFTAGLRLATGDNNSPVSTNQSFGTKGGFAKYDLWLDRGFIKWESNTEPVRTVVEKYDPETKTTRVFEGESTPRGKLALTLGRFDNPFFRTDVMWDDDLGFDGVALQAQYRITDWLTPFLNAGAFPVHNTSFNYATNQPAKFASEDKYLYGVQLGAKLKVTKDVDFKGAAALYQFDNIDGRLSSPFVPLSTSDVGDTDDTRPLFAQKGNTYMALRNIPAVEANDYGTKYQYQYYGLSSEFQPFALTGKLDFNHWEPVQISVFGEYIRNLAFDAEAINAEAVNNRGAIEEGADIGAFDGGDTAWILGINFGAPALEKRWDWNLGFSYRYVETDAIVDGFTDSDFGLGGTNVKGYSVFGSLALAPRVFLRVNWMSATEVSGPPFRSDIYQLEISAKF